MIGREGTIGLGNQAVVVAKIGELHSFWIAVRMIHLNVIRYVPLQ
jgi:hypothetical protein